VADIVGKETQTSKRVADYERKQGRIPPGKVAMKDPQTRTDDCGMNWKPEKGQQLWLQILGRKLLLYRVAVIRNG
jgi:hypothetical protein